ncbi:hypothetical protein PoB_005279600 [Plakobranchus ocellatus]|uniref:Uncharacterized protein n=1 Tax=Plakobranchus ocellatus TaxID=259542 RepID=A0AAV4BSU3_9GAST|nr:hypothetical protein PoB_005279600 [Plakobranchus ocellatus]
MNVRFFEARPTNRQSSDVPPSWTKRVYGDTQPMPTWTISHRTCNIGSLCLAWTSERRKEHGKKTALYVSPAKLVDPPSYLLTWLTDSRDARHKLTGTQYF